ncbi:MAG TPA: NTP transferase domain-containing protein [Firmicutes bacterium]|jgi:mannose-1-phosphate guanylyltransferase/phosphomannomutase|nr:NTP transferase domain-containing protein [Bacillota bacterium]
MKAIVMAGGKGTRLRPLTCKQPKPMVPIAGKPMIGYILELLKKYHFTDIGMTLFYLPELITNYFGDGHEFGVSVRYFLEESPLGTAGSVKNAESFLDETFLVISGDALTDINLAEAVAFHRARRALVTIVLTKVANPLDYGVVITAEDGRIKRFLEKPGWGEVFSDTVNTGIYLIEPEVFRYYEKNKAVDFSKDLFPLLLQAGKPLYGFVAEGYWSDVGNLAQYRQANYDLLDGKLEFTPPGQEIAPGLWVGEGTELAPDCVVEGPVVLGRYVRVGKRALLGKNSIIGDYSLVEEEASLKKAILWNHTYVGYRTEIRGAILAHHTHLKSGVSVYEGAVLGEGCTVGAKTVIKPEIRTWPEKYVESGSVLNSSLVWGNRWGTNLFGRQGISKTANLEFTPEFAAKLGVAYGTVLPEKSRVVMGADHCPAAQKLKTALVSGLLGTGIDLYDLGQTATPVTRRAVVALAAAGGIQLRVSPLAPEDLLVEFIDDQGLNINRALERKIEQTFFAEEFRRTPLTRLGQVIEVADFFPRYLEEILQVTLPEQIQGIGFKVVAGVETPEGPLGAFLTRLLAALGCSTRSLSQRAIGSHRTLKELKTQAASALAVQVRQDGADLGVMLIGNGEGLILVDEEGTLVQEEQFTALLSLAALKDPGAGTVPLPVTAPFFIEEMVKANRGTVVRTKASPRGLMEKVVEARLFPAGDGRGCFQAAYDGFYALTKILELMAREKRSLGRLVTLLPPYYIDQKQVDCSWEDKGRIMRHLFEENKEREIEVIDGLKVFHDRGWALVLPDPEEPAFQIFSEAVSPEMATELTAFYTDRITDLQLK